jgi:cytidine deaminase
MTPPDSLVAAAKRARSHAYAPYSGFRVGSALRTVDGETFSGANIENASYGLSRCAEQSAILAMASSGARRAEEIVVYTETDSPSTPCGACRQILSELAPDATVWLVNHLGVVERTSVAELLPNAFAL